MGGIRNIIKESLKILTDGNAWVLFYKKERSWYIKILECEEGSYEEGLVFNAENQEGIIRIAKCDAKAICINGKCNGFYEDISISKATEKITEIYKNHNHPMKLAKMLQKHRICGMDTSIIPKPRFRAGKYIAEYQDSYVVVNSSFIFDITGNGKNDPQNPRFYHLSDGTVWLVEINKTEKIQWSKLYAKGLRIIENFCLNYYTETRWESWVYRPEKLRHITKRIEEHCFWKYY